MITARAQAFRVPLFAVEQAATTTGTWMLARYPAHVWCPSFHAVSQMAKDYQLIMLPPECSPPLDDAAETTAAWMNKVVEKCIMMAPQQYMWLHRRFKTPEGVTFTLLNLPCRMLRMASGITAANPPDLAIKALWIAPPGSRALISVLIFSSYVHRAWRTNSGLLSHPVKMTPL
ncbi:hypothetical protein ACLBOM_22840 [Escherichia coli]